MDDEAFGRLLEFLGLSWRGYRKVRKGVKKRVGRHMQEQGCRSMGAYLEKLSLDEDIRRQCERVMGVSISRFFRDRRLWEVLQKQLLPELMDTFKDRLQVWCAGCACGEEVYSLMILWEQLSRLNADFPAMDLIATDLNPHHLEKAKEACFPLSSLKEVPKDLVKTCFEAESGKKRFKLKPAFREGISWLQHDFLSDPPGSGFQLVFIRNNLLTYYQNRRIEPALDNIIKVLCPGGCLVIGMHESLPYQVSDLHPYPPLSYIFKKGA